MNNTIVLQLKNIIKRYTLYEKTRNSLKNINIINNINLTLHAKESIALLGPSGIGKSTLLNILGLLDIPTSGEIIFLGNSISKSMESIKTKMRKKHMGFIYQNYHLLSEFTALENVILPQIINNKTFNKASQNADKLLQIVGLEKRLNHFPEQLSGGEQQRVAIARSLANNPIILIADEPTGNLDSKNSKNIFKILIRLVKKNNISTIIATHNENLAQELDRIIQLY